MSLFVPFSVRPNYGSASTHDRSTSDNGASSTECSTTSKAISRRRSTPKLAKCSNDTALRDIRGLLERGIIVKNPGGGRSTSYRLADPDDVQV